MTTPVPYDPRVVAEYDLLNPDGPDHDWFRALADEIGATRVADLGCGTGILTVTLARPGRSVVGIDPSPQMLEFAAARPGAASVEWRLGGSEELPDAVDLVVMSGNVAMHVLGADWQRTLEDVRRALRPGGVLAFETRNPDAGAWRGWNDPGSTRSTPAGEVHETLTTTRPDEHGIVTMTGTTTYLTTGETVASTQRLQFRGVDDIVHDLGDAGLAVRSLWQSWHREPFDPAGTAPLVIVEATPA